MNEELRDKTLPIRYSLEEIEAKKDQIKLYVVLPIPQFSGHTPFETIGRTTFKKYVKKSYEELQLRKELPLGDYINIPFVVLHKIKNPYVVCLQDIKGEAEEEIANKENMDTAPPHSKFMLLTKLAKVLNDPQIFHISVDEMKVFTLSGTDLKIQITNDNPKTYYNCTTYDTNLHNADYWHLIVVSYTGSLSVTKKPSKAKI